MTLVYCCHNYTYYKKYLKHEDSNNDYYHYLNCMKSKDKNISSNNNILRLT